MTVCDLASLSPYAMFTIEFVLAEGGGQRQMLHTENLDGEGQPVVLFTYRLDGGHPGVAAYGASELRGQLRLLPGGQVAASPLTPGRRATLTANRLQ